MSDEQGTQKPKSPRAIVKAAVDYYKNVTDNIDTTKLRLEEIIQDDDVWRVTLSYPQQEDLIFGYSGNREYKEFSIDPISGNVRAMKIKKV